MSWVTFETAGGGLVAVQPQHVVAIYDKQGAEKPSTTACGVYVLKDTTVQRAAMRLTIADEAAASARENDASARLSGSGPQ